ncbi:MAG: DUF4398 domain-containing protein [Treponema sp.]|nr:DUF4398 domain-containing protein [Treponema sp.]
MTIPEKIRITMLISAALTIALVSGGCAKPPTEEMNNAVAAVTRAENDADAVAYAGSALVRARESLNRMQTEADSKRYDAARAYAAEAVAAADKAVADGRAGAVRAREEAASFISALKPVVSETGEAIRTAKAARNLALDFADIDRDFEAARRTAEQAEVSLAGNKYQDALDKGRSARAGLSDINMRLSQAATAASRKK